MFIYKSSSKTRAEIMHERTVTVFLCMQLVVVDIIVAVVRGDTTTMNVIGGGDGVQGHHPLQQSLSVATQQMAEWTQKA